MEIEHQNDSSFIFAFFFFFSIVASFHEGTQNQTRDTLSYVKIIKSNVLRGCFVLLVS